MNNITISGNLGRDAVSGTSKGGKFYTMFSVGVNDGKKDGEKQTIWVSVAAFGDFYQGVSQYLKKGTYVIISGRAGVKPAKGDYEAQLQVFAQNIELGPNRRQEEDEEDTETASEQTQATDEDASF